MEYQISTFKPIDLTDLTKQADTFVATVNQPKALPYPSQVSDTATTVVKIPYIYAGIGSGMASGIGFSLYKRFKFGKSVLSTIIGGLIGGSISYGIALTKK